MDLFTLFFDACFFRIFPVAKNNLYISGTSVVLWIWKNLGSLQMHLFSCGGSLALLVLLFS